MCDIRDMRIDYQKVACHACHAWETPELDPCCRVLQHTFKVLLLGLGHHRRKRNTFLLFQCSRCFCHFRHSVQHGLALSFGHLFRWSESTQLTENQEHWDKQDKTFNFLQSINKFRNERKVILHSRDTKKKKWKSLKIIWLRPYH